MTVWSACRATGRWFVETELGVGQLHRGAVAASEARVGPAGRGCFDPAIDPGAPEARICNS
eukprot:476818-Rhodomonas_salina.1